MRIDERGNSCCHDRNVMTQFYTALKMHNSQSIAFEISQHQRSISPKAMRQLQWNLGFHSIYSTNKKDRLFLAISVDASHLAATLLTLYLQLIILIIISLLYRHIGINTNQKK